MLPPMKSNSKQATTTLMLCTVPPMTTSASVSPVLSIASLRRSGYLRLSLNFSASTGNTSWPISKRPSLSRNMFSRARAPMRWWRLQVGQTFWFCSRSVL
jgi:hypothetical protein